ncbi:60S ribosomal protein L2, mitochondrial [Mercurialis annua]|uniref:60S ribosomal protein L2, mitochondrial n=1 Tax=Mercurialis annua TaxID=3986 RepID=UPI00215FFE78|nr:60S ribosomal protein L2, mitochondrial [Mercurialis annua]
MAAAVWNRARVASSSSLHYYRLLEPSSCSRSSLINLFRNFSTDVADTPSFKENMMKQMAHLDINSQVGTCMRLGSMRIGTLIHNIEMNPGQGGKLVRAAGTFAKIMKEPTEKTCLVKLPSGVEKLIDSQCRATIGKVSNASHNTRKLRKAGHSRWLGRRPVVRGVAMNPVDHPHGGGEGRSKSSGSFGRVSQTPWGKPTKCGRNQQKKREGKFGLLLPQKSKDKSIKRLRWQEQESARGKSK